MSHLSSRSRLFIAGIFLVAAAYGALAWSGYFYALALLVLFPLLLRFCHNRDELLAVVTGYFVGATWQIVPGARVFFGAHLSIAATFLLWFGLVCLLAAPFLLLRPAWRLRLWWGLPTVLLVSALSPFGIANPLTVAGVLFPGTSWCGLICTLVAFGAAAVWPARALAATLSLSLVCTVSAPPVRRAAPDWRGVNTTFGGTGFGNAPIPHRFDDALTLQRMALHAPNTTLVFPESVVSRWNSATELFWEDTFAELRRRNTTAIIGVTESLPGGRGYTNGLIVRGLHSGTYRQRIPIPYAMWRPFSQDGVPLNITGPATLVVGNERVAPLVCYEQLLVLPPLTAMRDKPTLFLAVSNAYWARGTYIVSIQQAAVRAWSRLFGVPVVTAVNQ